MHFLPTKLSLRSKIWIWDPGSEIRDPRSGIRKKEAVNDKFDGGIECLKGLSHEIRDGLGI
jgi:hypothetical protein